MKYAVSVLLFTVDVMSLSVGRNNKPLSYKLQYIECIRSIAPKSLHSSFRSCVGFFHFSAISLITSPARISPAAPGTKDTEPGI